MMLLKLVTMALAAHVVIESLATIVLSQDWTI